MVPASTVYPLSTRQLQIVNFIRQFKEDHDISPTIREICDALTFGSTASVAYQLDRLEALGALRRLPNRARAIRLLI
jgi:SOS-response transcriptional repressor LexA